MKNSKEYSSRIGKLHRSLKRKYSKIEKVTYAEPLDAVIYAIISENTSDSSARSAIKRFNNFFVDINDLRVSRPEEIMEMLGEDTPEARDTASSVLTILRAVFAKYNVTTLSSLKKTGKRIAKQVLEKFGTMSRFVIEYCMLTSLGSHSIPLTKVMIDYLRDNDLVHPLADEQQIEGFLCRQISANKSYEFYALLRRESESRRKRTKSKKSKMSDKAEKKNVKVKKRVKKK